MSHRFKKPTKHGKLDRKAAKWEPKARSPVPVYSWGPGPSLDKIDELCIRCKQFTDRLYGSYCHACFIQIRDAVLLVKKSGLKWGLCERCGFVPDIAGQCSLCQTTLLRTIDIFRFNRSPNELTSDDWGTFGRWDKAVTKIDEDVFLRQPKEGRLILL